MNKQELIATIAEKSDLKVNQVDAVLHAMFDVIQQTLVDQGNVAIPKFGNFQIKVRAERKGRNPATGQEMIIPQAIVPVFKPSTQLKEAVNLKKSKKNDNYV